MIVVTGAAGFIGSTLLRSLTRAGDGHVVGIDTRETPAKVQNVSDCPDVTWVEPADTFTFLSRHADEINAVVHLGAETSTTATDRDAVFATNVTLSQDLWSFCSEAHVPFIYASSASVYGDGSQGFSCTPTRQAMEALAPLNLYGESKLAFDRFVAETVEAGKACPPQWAGLRFFNVYGAREAHKGTQASVVSQMYPVISRGEPYPLFRSHNETVPDGEQRRDFVFVGDCVKVMIWLLETPAVSGLFNVGTGQARTFIDLSRAVYAAAGLPFRIEWRDTPEHLRAHYQYFTEADLTGLLAAGYKEPFTPLENGVTLTVRELQNRSS